MAGGMNDFAASLRHDGLLPALDAWLRRPDVLPNGPFDAKTETPWVCKLGRSGSDDVAARFFMSALVNDSLAPGDLLQGIVAADGNARRDAAKLAKNRAAGMKPQVPADFLGLIETLWIPLALWCKSASEICNGFRQPQDRIVFKSAKDLPEARRRAQEAAEDERKAHKKISNNISSLGFAASWVKTLRKPATGN